MKLQNLKIRDKLYCRLSGGKGVTYKVRIEEIVSDELFITDLPIVTSSFVAFKLATKLDFIYSSPFGMEYFKGEVVEVSREKEYMVIKQFVRSGKTIQRRGFFRLDITQAFYTAKFENFFSFETVFDKCLTIDISAGGLKFKTIETYNLGDIIYLNLSFLPDDIRIWGRILKITKLEELPDEIYNFAIALEFYDLSENEREFLVKFILRKQREYFRVANKKNTII